MRDDACTASPRPVPPGSTRALAHAWPPGLGVLAACWTVQQVPALPGRAWGWWFAVAGALIWAALLLRLASVQASRSVPLPQALRGTLAPVVPCLAAALLAAGWALERAHARLDQRLDPALEGRELLVVGIVEDMPQAFDRGVRFRLRIEACPRDPRECPGDVAVRLGWYRGFTPFGGDPPPSDASSVASSGQAKPRARHASGARADADPGEAPRVSAGERWQLMVRLKRPHATLNPGLFDSELRALEEGIAATGTVRSDRREPGLNRRIDPFVPGVRTVIERARQTLRDAMQAAMREQAAAPRGVMLALAVGDQAAIDAEWWSLFNRTGVGHLMSISGLHITMLAALGGRAAGALWSNLRLARRMRDRPLPAWLPTPHARWLFGVATAFAYAALAGWGIPAQRTCWMVAAAGCAMLAGRGRSTLDVLSTAAAVVCVLDPWAPMAAGFWLSFAAVGAIVWFGSGEGRAAASTRHADRRSRWRALLGAAARTQIAATLALLPLGIVFFSSVSIVGPVANAFAIPLVSAVVTPLALAGGALSLASEQAGALLLVPGAWLSEALLAALAWIDFDGRGALSIPSPDAPSLLVAVAACAVLLAPAPLPRRWLAGTAMLPLVLAPPSTLPAGAIRLTALDVGQGTAVLVETAAGRLLYDTGPTLGGDADAGSRTIVPWLRSRGIDRLQALVVSHQDSDHAGGALAVLRALGVDWTASSLPSAHPIVVASRRHHACRRGEGWQWGEVRFDWLHPGDDADLPARSSTNARSCVLRIRGAGGSVLLAGDIEAGQERRLLEVFRPEALAATVLLVPHHGSRTSSTPEFIDAVAPRLAVFQVGYRNRYRHPNPVVMERYVARDIGILRSDHHAAIVIRLDPGAVPSVHRWRIDAPRYWRVRVDRERNAIP